MLIADIGTESSYYVKRLFRKKLYTKSKRNKTIPQSNQIQTEIEQVPRVISNNDEQHPALTPNNARALMMDTVAKIMDAWIFTMNMDAWISLVVFISKPL